MLSAPVGLINPKIAEALVEFGMIVHHRRAIVRHPLPQVSQFEELVAVSTGWEGLGQRTALIGVREKF